MGLSGPLMYYNVDVDDEVNVKDDVDDDGGGGGEMVGW